MTANNSPLEELFGPEATADLERLLRMLIPGNDELPDAHAAGVPTYLAAVLKKRKEQGKDDIKAYASFLTLLSQKSNELFQSPFSKLSGEQAEEVVKEAADPDKVFVKVRDEVFTGYLAHPRWRAQKDQELWLTIRYDPMFPCCERPDVKEREMLCEAPEQLSEHLHHPEDRLPEAVRAYQEDLVINFCSEGKGYTDPGGFNE